MKKAAFCICIGLLLAACTSSTTPVRYKQLTVEWQEPRCVGIATDESENRIINQQYIGLGQFAVEVCATDTIHDEQDYRGPVAVRIVDRRLQQVVAQEMWDSYDPQSTSFMPQDVLSIRFADGKHSFIWEANATQVAAASTYVPARILDYPNCIRQSHNSNEEQTQAYLFEYCYTSPEGAFEDLQKRADTGLLRLSALPSGQEIRMEHVEEMDIKNVVFKSDAIHFENKGIAMEWRLPEQ